MGCHFCGIGVKRVEVRGSVIFVGADCADYCAIRATVIDTPVPDAILAQPSREVGVSGIRVLEAQPRSTPREDLLSHEQWLHNLA